VLHVLAQNALITGSQSGVFKFRTKIISVFL